MMILCRFGLEFCAASNTLKDPVYVKVQGCLVVCDGSLHAAHLLGGSALAVE